MARRQGRDSKEILAISAAVLAVATLLAGLTARLLGATAAAGIWAVAIVSGLLGDQLLARRNLARTPQQES